MAPPYNDVASHLSWFTQTKSNIPRVNFLDSEIARNRHNMPESREPAGALPTPQSAHGDGDSEEELFVEEPMAGDDGVIVDSDSDDGFSQLKPDPMPERQIPGSTGARPDDPIVLTSSDPPELPEPPRNPPLIRRNDDSYSRRAPHEMHGSPLSQRDRIFDDNDNDEQAYLEAIHCSPGGNTRPLSPLHENINRGGAHNGDIEAVDSDSESDLRPGFMESIHHYQNLPSSPRVVFSQAAPNDPAPPTIGPLLTERIGLLERKVTLLQRALAQNKIHVDTAQLDMSIAQVMRRIDEFNAGNQDGDDWLDPGSALGSSPPRPSMDEPLERPTIESPGPEDEDEDGLIEESRRERLDSDVWITGESNVPHRPDAVVEQSPYFASRSRPEISAKRSFEQVIDDGDSDSDDGFGHPGHKLQSSQSQQASMQQHQKFAWSPEVMHTLRNKFGLPGFRPNQVEAINETLAGRDVVVLMPTGGGKSLCYQLPALCRTGATEGTTVVISPLISLMQDQVYHLRNRNIEAEMINSQLSYSERSAAFARLAGGELQLVYLSPEMLSASSQMNNTLKRLYDQRMFARIVIDEAHCVSQWGHDFRPDYKLLERLKTDFAGIPIMCLTATANSRVLLDILGCVRPQSLVLKQSFNRRNLIYEVRPKKKASVHAEIAAICRQFQGRSGIVYCHSKRSCEETADALRRAGISARHYHAGLTVEERQDAQVTWQNSGGGGRTGAGPCTVICATIAFGMGIDKPDVRFVIHLTLPRNMEGYYQETGRAGRDSKQSLCVLFYSYADVQLLQSMIQRDEGLNAQDKENHRNMLACVVQYCQNKTDCRRKQVLQYFGEAFDEVDCHRTCDNCRNMVGHVAIRRDVSSEARLCVGLVNSIWRDKVTTLQCIDIMKGSQSRKIIGAGYHQHPQYSTLASLNRTDIERLFHLLVAERVLEEYSVFVGRYPQTYLKPGPQSGVVLHGQQPIFLTSCDGPPARPPTYDAVPIPPATVSDRRSAASPARKRPRHNGGTSSGRRTRQSGRLTRGGSARGTRGGSRGTSRTGTRGSARGASTSYVRTLY